VICDLPRPCIRVPFGVVVHAAASGCLLSCQLNTLASVLTEYVRHGPALFFSAATGAEIPWGAPRTLTCRFRKLYPFDSQSPTNQNKIAE
jgi:hypothetical protein